MNDPAETPEAGRQTGDGWEPTVLLLMPSGPDRRLLGELLDDGYQVSATTDPSALDDAFDCCVLDPRTFADVSDRLEQRREHEDGFLPFVLVIERDRGDRLPDGVWDLVDEVIESPVRRAALRARIDNLVERRRASLALLEREAALRERNERLDTFTSVVSHDLRNPLTVAEGRLELAMEEVDNEHLEAIAGAHDRIRTLIEELLTLARESQPGVELERVAVDELAETCWGTVETANAVLTVPEAFAVEADPGRLRQLLENLLRNAIEHGGDAVTIEIGPLPDGFYVADDGPGIPAADRERVLESGVSTTETGTGLGLAIVSEIADAHGWMVGVTEGAAGGARFEFTGVRRQA